MSSARIIKKYPNRRLYDTDESRYITLADVRALVIAKKDFVVIDKKSGDDITRTILLQVISEQEQKGDAVMNRDFLSQVIRSYEKVMPAFVADYLEQSMQFFMNRQQSLRGRLRRVVGADPVSTVADIAEKNFARWKALQEEVLSRFGSSSRLAESGNEGALEDRQKAG